jgi:hypothetical protein
MPGRGSDGGGYALEFMRMIKTMLVIGCLCWLVASPAGAADSKAVKKQTCCEKAAAESKECKHKCCVTAHKQGKSCEKCNPNKEDLKLKKPDKKPAPKAEK